MTPTILISFDVEEFDMPLEYNFPISIESQMEIGKKGLETKLNQQKPNPITNHQITHNHQKINHHTHNNQKK